MKRVRVTDLPAVTLRPKQRGDPHKSPKAVKFVTRFLCVCAYIYINTFVVTPQARNPSIKRLSLSKLLSPPLEFHSNEEIIIRYNEKEKNGEEELGFDGA